MHSPQPGPAYLIGYSEFCANLPGGRAANTLTTRAFVINADGSGRRELAPQLILGPNTSTRFCAWSPDGRMAAIECKWESVENAAWEEEHQRFRFETNGYLTDFWLLDMESESLTNVTAPERVSTCSYNNVFVWPNEPNRAGFVALIGAEARPFSMNLDGTGKRPLSEGPGYVYGLSASPDGARIVYHRDYQLYIADTDGGNARRVETGNEFDFVPVWSPDGNWVAFVGGPNSTDCSHYLVRRDGTGLRKIAERGDYDGVTLFLDVPDHHEGSSDYPAWSRDSDRLYYTAKAGEAVELMCVSLEGEVEQLTHSAPGVTHYHPDVSPDGQGLIYGSNREGVRQLFAARADGTDERQITGMTYGHAAMWPSWQPGGTVRPGND